MGLPVVHPAARLFDHFQEVFRDVALVLPTVFAHQTFQTYCRKITDVLRGVSNEFVIPCAITPDSIDDQNRPNSHRTGRKDLKIHFETEEKQDKQPAAGALESEKTTKQPADGTQGPRAVTKKDWKQPASETQELTSNGMPMSPVHAMPGGNTPFGPSPRPALPAVGISDHPTHAMPSGLSDPWGPSQCFLPTRQSKDFQARSDGGLKAFASGPGVCQVDFPRLTLADKSVPKTQLDDASAELDSPSSLTASLVRALDGLESHNFSPEPITNDPEPMDDQRMDGQASTDARLDNDDDSWHHVQIYHPEDVTPVIVKVSKACKVGSIEVAEGNLGAMSQLVRANDVVGCALKMGSVTVPFQEVFLRDMDTYPLDAAHDNQMPAALTSHDPVPRQHLLLKQEAWVANDEFCHYLASVAANSTAKWVAPCLMPKCTLDDELINLLQAWEQKCKLALTTCTRIMSAILVEEHWLVSGFLHFLAIRFVALQMDAFGFKPCCRKDGDRYQLSLW